VSFDLTLALIGSSEFEEDRIRAWCEAPLVRMFEQRLEEISSYPRRKLESASASTNGCQPC
jgi:hypothetical protein